MRLRVNAVGRSGIGVPIGKGGEWSAKTREISMNSRDHWERIYAAKAPDQVSWYAPHLLASLELVERAAVDRAAAIIDAGGGESTLVDDLLAREYGNVTVLDISQTAIDANRKRLGTNAERVQWIAADITQAELPAARYDIWHDRAVFHFLTDPAARAAYVRQVARAMKPGGHVIVSTFGPEGPLRCSGLEVVRYDAETLQGEFGRRFRLVESSTQTHQTPFGTEQQFLFSCFKFESRTV
jgi:2-polyprenyl-3-methyl-5-hydroxy-6-metoxy-1,4-benzoquinol methylase